MNGRTDLELFEHVHECQTVLGFISGRSTTLLNQRSCPALESSGRGEKTYLYSSGSSLPPAPSLAFFDAPASRTSCSGLCLPFISTADWVGMLDVILEGISKRMAQARDEAGEMRLLL